MAPHLKEAGKARIMSLLGVGLSLSQVAETCGVDRRTVKMLKKRFLEQSQEAQDAFRIPDMLS